MSLNNAPHERLLRFERPNDFQDRPLWHDDVDVKTAPPVKILGGYSFGKDQFLKCGLHSCRHIHGTGFLALLKDGRETHIGRDCGKTHVGAEWAVLQREFVAAERAQIQRDLIQAILEKKDATLARAIKAHADVLVAEELLGEITRELQSDNALFRAMSEIARLDGRLTYYREPTENERAIRGGQTIAESVGTMAGTGAWNLRSPARDLQYRVIAPLHELTHGSVQTLKTSALGEKEKWLADLEDTLRAADEYQRQTRLFRRASNWIAFDRYCQLSNLRLSDRGGRVLRRLLSVTGAGEA